MKFFRHSKNKNKIIIYNILCGYWVGKPENRENYRRQSHICIVKCDFAREGSITKNFEERGSGYNFKGSGLCSCLICIITMLQLIITRACRLIWDEPRNSLCFIFFLVCAIFYFTVLWCAGSPKNPIVASYTILSQEPSQHLHPIMKPQSFLWVQMLHSW